MTQHRHIALGVDIGTTNTKVVVVEVADPAIGGAHDSRGVREVRRRSVPTPVGAAALRDAVLGAIEAVTRGGDERVDAVGIASMAETGALLDRAGEPLGDLLRWNDGDSDAVDDLVSSVGAAALYDATGVPVPAKTPVARWLQLQRDGDSRLRDARWAGVADEIALALTGSFATDHTLAARTMAYRSLPLTEALPASFDPELTALGGFSVDRLPTVLRPGEPAGAVTAEAAARTGLTAGIPVHIVGHDHAVGAWAADVRAHGEAANSVGTAEALFRVSDTSISRDAARRAGMSIARTVDGAHESLLAGNPTAGGLVEWAFRTILPTADRERTLAEAARAAADWQGEPLVLPYLRGRQAPHPDPSAVFRVVDRSGATAALPADPGDALTAILGGLVLQLAWLDAEQAEVIGASGARASTLRVLGGPGAANDAWWTLKRALIPGAVTRVESTEPVATGAALLALRDATGASPVLSARQEADGDAAEGAMAASAGASPLLADFIAAATASHPDSPHPASPHPRSPHPAAR
ncbi:L-fuculokinase [Leifsonia sp. NPDC058292]|uniref:FGGY-family carbohydrate kinase n=1 Tax=Leifsonia sp. NPDC058292 TaxID=3346428 RepID=UPI0036DC0B86